VVLNYRRKKQNHFKLFSEGYFEHLAGISNECEEERDRRSSALKNCIQKLKQRDQDLVACRYGETVITCKEVAKRLGRPVNTVYKSFQRIQSALLDCIQKTLIQEEHV
jgi:DNA-directed RNA polymerase specialized sigma24 family protein